MRTAVVQYKFAASL